ncbi:MAG: iron-containing alcohol dehydrogenase, partial [Rhodobacteraceae bacterium]|nr:iron-containing alcohol dehydrogenase [Paracoccaceae bacterium]
MTTLIANWSYPTAIKFGAERIVQLADHCRDAGMRRPLLVTDRALAALPITARALDILDAGGLGRAMFSGVDANPTEENLAAGIATFVAGGHDGVVAFGGGSALDLGKLVALMAGQREDLSVWDLEDVGDWWTRADPRAIAPVVAVPTTAGTGSECQSFALISDAATHAKMACGDPKAAPRIA